MLAWILSSRLQGVIAGPVDDLARTAAEVSASKNFNLRAVKHGEDELGILTDSFNTMLETIQDRDDALRDSEVKYRTLVDHAGDAILVAQDAAIKFANPQAIRLAGYTEQELLNISWVELIHPEDRALLEERHRARIAGEPVSETVAFRFLRLGGEVRWVQMNSAGLAWEGRPATLNFVRDVTEQTRTEEHLRQNQKMEAIGTLAGGIAHDFNNILGIMMGYAEIALLKVPQQSPGRRKPGADPRRRATRRKTRGADSHLQPTGGDGAGALCDHADREGDRQIHARLAPGQHRNP